MEASKKPPISNFKIRCNISVYSIICNKVADCMATYGACVLIFVSLVFMSQAPSFVFDLVSRDKPGAGC